MKCVRKFTAFPPPTLQTQSFCVYSSELVLSGRKELRCGGGKNAAHARFTLRPLHWRPPRYSWSPRHEASRNRTGLHDWRGGAISVLGLRQHLEPTPTGSKLPLVPALGSGRAGRCSLRWAAYSCIQQQRTARVWPIEFDEHSSRDAHAMVGPMTVFRLVCRSAEVGRGQFLAVVTALEEPVGSGASECDMSTASTAQEANAACQDMARTMRQRIEARGDSISRTNWL